MTEGTAGNLTSNRCPALGRDIRPRGSQPSSPRKMGCTTLLQPVSFGDWPRGRLAALTRLLLLPRADCHIPAPGGADSAHRALLQKVKERLSTCTGALASLPRPMTQPVYTCPGQGARPACGRRGPAPGPPRTQARRPPRPQRLGHTRGAVPRRGRVPAPRRLCW